MALVGSSHFRFIGGVLLLLSGLVCRPSDCTVEVTVEQVEAYSALLRWSLTARANTTVTGFSVELQLQSDTKMIDSVVIDDSDAASHRLTSLDDMRHYNACVVTQVAPGGGLAETGCAAFTTPAGNSTYLAVASGVFLVLCLLVFGVLDFLVSRKRKEQVSDKEEELLQQGWQTFQRNSKKKQKGKKRQAPGKSRPDSSTSIPDATAGAIPADTVV